MPVPVQALQVAKDVIVLESNFDRLRVLSITAQVSVDEVAEEEEEDGFDGDERGEGSKDARRLRARPGIGARRRSSNRSAGAQRPGYTEAVGDVRLAWRWVEGWRARLRKGVDVVERGRWEWRVDRQVVGAGEVPVVQVVPGEEEVAEREEC